MVSCPRNQFQTAFFRLNSVDRRDWTSDEPPYQVKGTGNLLAPQDAIIYLRCPASHSVAVEGLIDKCQFRNQSRKTAGSSASSVDRYVKLVYNS